MAKGKSRVSRRRFLAQASATLGTAAVGSACGSSEDSKGGDPDAGAAATGGAGGADGEDAGGASGGGGPAATGGGPGKGGAGGAPPGGGGAVSGGAPASGGADGGAARVVVAAVARASVDEAVARAIELAGGLDAIKPGQTVFIKPNVVSDRMVGTPGIRTSPEVLAAVIRAVKARDPGHVVVGDRSARAFPDTAAVFANTGLGQAALDAGADEVYAAESPIDAPDDWVLMKPPSYEETWGNAGGILAMRRILEADHLIDVPTCKDHRYALFSLSMKNFIGAIGDSSRDPIHYASTLSGNFDVIGRDIAVLNQIFSPLLCIVDATTALVNGGPEGDGRDAVRTTPGMILASKDRVALDAFGVALLQHQLETATVPIPDAANPVLRQERAWSLPQIVNAVALGVGAASAAAVDIAFDGVDAAAAIEALFRA